MYTFGDGPSRQGIYRHVIKRGLDVVCSALLLICLSPLLVLCALAVLVTSGRPILFIQERLGRDGAVFRMYKFRTMRVGSEHTGSGVYSDRSDPRVTRVGRFLRAASLDELPQLFNILRGDMSFIGPRPPLTYHPWPLDEYTDEGRRMFEVRPGLTGWAQVHGRRGVEWNLRIHMNVWYVDHLTFPLDVKIFILTFAALLRRDEEGTTVSDETVPSEAVPMGRNQHKSDPAGVGGKADLSRHKQA